MLSATLMSSLSPHEMQRCYELLTKRKHQYNKLEKKKIKETYTEILGKYKIYIRTSPHNEKKKKKKKATWNKLLK
jgi:hypothetical protein